ncbi:MAG: hypothetical protein HKN43_12235 [Rhodothermales bacterium]|nr:hypothetical protein [Rhodothermales bacterium]
MFAGCSASRESTVTVDEQYGHRYDGKSPDGRETHVILQADSGEEYAIHPAVFDTVHVRPQEMDTPQDSAVKVELLIKGSFPDSCTRLHALTQERSGNIVNISLDMRRPRSAICASVVRPYRFYMELEGDYAAGNYTIKLNEAVRTFTIRSLDS